MSGFTKVTVIGASRKATLVVPTEDPVGLHLSDIATLLQEPRDPESGPLTVVTPLGVELDPALALAEQNIADGSVLRLIRSDDVPSPPEVTDVTDTVAGLRDTTVRSWSARHRHTIGAIGAALLTALVVRAIGDGLGWIGLLVLGAAAIASVLFGRIGRDGASLLTTGIAVGAAVPVAALILGWLPHGLPQPAGYATILAGVVWLVLGAGFGAGRRDAAAAIGAATGVILSTLALALLAGLGVAGMTAVIAVIAVAGLGILPGLALALSGVTALDDRVIAGALPDRLQVAGAVDEAFRIFTWTVYALAVPAALSAALLVTSGEMWAMLLGAGVIVVILLRTRIMPLAVQAWSLWAAGGAAGIAGVVLAPGIPSWAQFASLLAGVLTIVVLTLARPSAQARIRLRRLGDQVETIAAISLVPSLLGVFGVYNFMVAVFP